MLAQILTTIVMTHPITPLHTYNGLDNGIVVDINLEEEVDKARLVLGFLLQLLGWGALCRRLL